MNRDALTALTKLRRTRDRDWRFAYLPLEVKIEVDQTEHRRPVSKRHRTQRDNWLILRHLSATPIFSTAGRAQLSRLP